MIGLGLLEAIPEADILALDDPDDADGDGISGRANRVWSESDGRPMLGRFGWKAGQPTIREQSASAFSGDIGISTTVLPEGWGECTEAQAACRAAPDGRTRRAAPRPTTPSSTSSPSTAATSPSPPAATSTTREVLRGKQVFYEAGCAACHRPKFVTDRLADQPEQSFQLIWPYTDLLLHDMGEGLADHRPEARATGTRMAHRAALGHRPHRDRHRQGELPPRRPRPHPARSRPLARRRGASRPRRRRRPAQGRPRRPGPLPGVALMRFPGAHSRPATSAEAPRRRTSRACARQEKDPEARRRNARPINGHEQKVNAADIIQRYQQLDPRRARATPRDSTPPARPLGPPRSPI